MKKFKKLLLLLLLMPIFVNADMGGPIFDKTDAQVIIDNVKVYNAIWDANEKKDKYIETNDVKLENGEIITISEEFDKYAGFSKDGNYYYIELSNIKYIPADISIYNLDKSSRYYTILETNVYESTSVTSEVVGTIEREKNIELYEARLYNKTDASYRNYYYNWRYYKSEDIEGWVLVEDYTYTFDKNVVTVSEYTENQKKLLDIKKLYNNPIDIEEIDEYGKYGEIVLTDLYFYNRELEKGYYHITGEISGWINDDVIAKSYDEEYYVINPSVKTYDKPNGEYVDVELTKEKIIYSRYYYYDDENGPYVNFNISNQDFWIKSNDNDIIKVDYFYDKIFDEEYYFNDVNLTDKVGVLKPGSYKAAYIEYINRSYTYYVLGYGYVNSSNKYVAEDYYEYNNYKLHFDYEVPYYNNEDLNEISGIIRQGTIAEFDVALINSFDNNTYIYYLKDYGYVLSTKKIEEFVYYEKDEWDYEPKKEENDNAELYFTIGFIALSLTALLSIILIKKRQNKKSMVIEQEPKIDVSNNE